MFMSGENVQEAVVICIENEEIRCSRRKLAEASKYFDAMFNGNFIESVQKSIHIKDINLPSFQNILNLIDDDKFIIHEEEVLDTLMAACILQVERIQDHCIKKLTENLSAQNSLQIWQICEKLNIHPLAEKAKCKALIEFNVIRTADSFTSLSIEELHSYLSSTSLQCQSEIHVLETGLKWWQDHKNDNISDPTELSYETKCLLTLLNCIDFTAMSKEEVVSVKAHPYIAENTIIQNILDNYLIYLNDNTAEFPEHLYQYVRTLIYKREKRRPKLLPCIVSRELQNTEGDKSGNNPSRDSNIYFYDSEHGMMKKLCDDILQSCTSYNSLLEGYHILSYRENMIFFGGQYKYGTANWNKNVCMYNTITEQWKIITKLPIQRRHFKSCLINNKLFIIGGTGKFRILQNDMFYYDFITDTWITNIPLPPSLFYIYLKCCEFRNKLFLMCGNLNNKVGYIFNVETKLWDIVKIEENFQKFPDGIGLFLIYEYQDLLYIKGNYLIELELENYTLEVRNCEKIDPLESDQYTYFTNNDSLYIFSIVDAFSDNYGFNVLSQYSIPNKTTDVLIKFEQTINFSWILNCFGLLHYSLLAANSCISNVIYE